jgi:hypothetical protein
MLLALIPLTSLQLLTAQGLLVWPVMSPVLGATILLALLGWVFLFALVAWSLRRETASPLRRRRRPVRTARRGPLRQETIWPPADERFRLARRVGHALPYGRRCANNQDQSPGSA